MKIWYDKLTPAQRAAYQRGVDQVRSQQAAQSQLGSRRGSVLSAVNESQYEDCY